MRVGRVLQYFGIQVYHKNTDKFYPLAGDADGKLSVGLVVDEVTVNPAPVQAEKVYIDGNTIYVCLADPGSLPSAAVWQIQKYDISSGVSITFADGNSNFDNTATDLSTVQGHSYS